MLAALALSVAACSSDSETMDDSARVAVEVNADISNSQATRATGTEWEAGDAMGVSATSNGNTSADNVRFYLSDGKFITDNAIYYQDAEPVTFSAYYPFCGTSGVDAGVIPATTADQTKQKEFDFLFTTGATASKANPKVNFTKQDENNDYRFRHCMSQVTIVFVSGNGLADLSKFSEFTISGLKMQGSFNTANGEAKTDDAAQQEDCTVATGISSALTSYTASSIFFPQSTADNKMTLTVVVDGVSYTAVLALPVTTESMLKAGNNVTYTVTVNKNAISVSSGEIAEWNTTAGDPVSAEM